MFPTAGHLAWWSGLCPGHNRSAGQRRRGRTTQGSRWRRAALVQAAWAASHTRGTYPAARSGRLARRRGRKRAPVALGQTLLVVVYHLLRRGSPSAEPGADDRDRLEPERLTRQRVRRLESLGHQVALQSRGAA